MLSWKTAACLAAGNTVVIKPAQVGAGAARGLRAWRAWALLAEQGQATGPFDPHTPPQPRTGGKEKPLQVRAACEGQPTGQTWCVWVSGPSQANQDVRAASW